MSVTNEPTEAQVEAAAKALEKLPLNLITRGEALDAARAALVAAQGAAPQSETYEHCCQHPKCPGDSLCCCASEQRLRNAWNQWLSEFDADAKQAFRDGYQAGQNDPAPWTAPVLPSSPESPAQAFADWHERWWRNEPDTIQKANAQAAFFAGWDARGLPSSGVDEDKLAEVIGRVTDLWDDPLDEVHDIPQIARAVAGWLKGQGGESRGE